MRSLNDELTRFLRDYVATQDGGSFSETDTSSTASPAVFGVQTLDAPLTLTPSVAAPATTTLNVLEGATISGGNTVTYTDLGQDTGGSLAVVTVSPTIDARGLLAISVLQAGVGNIGQIVLNPNTTYVFEITNTSVTAEPVRMGAIMRRPR